MSETASEMLAKERRQISPKQAREQAAEATGFCASIEIVIGDEVFEIPQRGLLDDDQRERMDELEMETESWDYEDDIVIPARTIRHPDGRVETIASQTMKGGLKMPYRKDGQLVRPSYPVRVAVALWGEDRYNEYKELGGRAADVTGTMARLDRRLEKRENGDEEEGKPADPKSEGGN
jgi:hypothetical protein